MDRNWERASAATWARRSLSARRAWIEIAGQPAHGLPSIASLSARRAWIEMAAACRPARGVAVALRKESVDRNL